jgi:hypothetical protein
VVWYLCLGAAVWGIIVTVRRHRGDVALLLAVMALWVLIAAMTGGNIGTAFRMRDMVTPFLLLFACVGAWAGVRGAAAVWPQAQPDT